MIWYVQLEAFSAFFRIGLVDDEVDALAKEIRLSRPRLFPKQRPRTLYWADLGGRSFWLRS